VTIQKIEGDHAEALQLSIDSTVESFKGSRDFYLINNRASLRGYQELRHRVIKNFSDSKETIHAWGLGDAEHQECVKEIKAVAKERSRLRAEAEAAQLMKRLRQPRMVTREMSMMMQLPKLVLIFELIINTGLLPFYYFTPCSGCGLFVCTITLIRLQPPFLN